MRITGALKELSDITVMDYVNHDTKRWFQDPLFQINLVSDENFPISFRMHYVNPIFKSFIKIFALIPSSIHNILTGRFTYK